MHGCGEKTVLLPTDGMRKQSACLAQHPFLEGRFFPVWVSGFWPRATTIASSLMGGCG